MPISAYNRFEPFNPKVKHIKNLGKVVIVIFLTFSLIVGSVAIRVPTAQAAVQTLFNHNEAANGTGGWPNVANTFRLNTANPDANSVEECGKYGKDAAGTVEQIPSSTPCTTATTSGEGTGGEAGGLFSVGQSGQYPAADASNPWKFDARLRNPTVGSTAGNYMLYAKVYKFVSGTYVTQFYSLFGDTTNGCPTTKPARSNGTAITPSSTVYVESWSCTNAPAVDLGGQGYLFIAYFIEINTASNSASASLVFVQEGQEVSGCTTIGGGCSKTQTTNFAVPETALILLPAAPFVPKTVEVIISLRRRLRQIASHRKK